MQIYLKIYLHISKSSTFAPTKLMTYTIRIIPLCKHSEWHASVALFSPKYLHFAPIYSGTTYKLPLLLSICQIVKSTPLKLLLFRVFICASQKNVLPLQRNRPYGMCAGSERMWFNSVKTEVQRMSTHPAYSCRPAMGMEMQRLRRVCILRGCCMPSHLFVIPFFFEFFVKSITLINCCKIITFSCFYLHDSKKCTTFVP